ncbi:MULTISPECIES: P-loop NTPase fold protein [Bacillus]|uniref:KAP-like P-loop domain-containing protein n=1 Tax=Bacillus mycoides TaxID=1405 RepID=A0A3D9V2S9_BACMY|nr:MULTISPECIES: P-loop NTPase fold protein [Bacillus]RBP25382.1 KAP-like P-loop domain-containing protein [Bacillus sp. DB-2]REF33265.1 KAP-like P-loop domain-containing protein [Bacillus mycoides]
MDTIFETIHEYIKLEKTNYAIQINGPWGIGKTHYVTKVLKEEIEEIEATPKDKYRVIYISLNGLKNVDEIGESVFLSSINKTGSYTYTIGRAGLEIGSKIPGFKFLEAVDKKISNITQYREHLQKCVLCFDDLERIDKSVTIQQVLGYINSTYIEHENIKTLFISNEEKLKENTEFYKIKEKVIGRTIQYIRGTNEVLPDFMKVNYGKNEKIIGFYERNYNTILQIINTISEKINLRTLRFVFDSLSQVINKCNSLEKNADIICLSIFTNILLISVDFKEGILKNKQELEPLYELDALGFMIEFEKKGIKVEKEYKRIFWDKYLKNKTILKEFMHIYKSVSEYILTGHLDIELFKEEIKREYNQEEGSKDKAIKVINNYMEFELDELNTNVDIVIQSLEKGEYHPYRYPRTYYLLFEFNEKGFVEINSQMLYEICNDGLEKAIESYEIDHDDYEDRFNRYLNVDFVNEGYEMLVIKLKHKIIEELREKKESILEGFFKSIKEGNIENFRVYIDKIRYENDFFTIINQEVVCDNLITSSNKGLGFFFSFLREKYLRVSNAHEFYSHEIDRIIAFQNTLSKRLSEVTIDALKKSIIVDLINCLENIIKHLSKDVEK